MMIQLYNQNNHRRVINNVMFSIDMPLKIGNDDVFLFFEVMV